jgi:DNA-binding transcriptional MerR regulator
MSIQDPQAAVYRSGVAARLSGVRVDTLRIWERRYSVVGPRLSAGRQRLYSTADIRRLSLIKQLVDMGHAIGTIASIGDEELSRMRAAAGFLNGARRAPREDREVRFALVGSMLMVEQMGRAVSGCGGRIVGSSPDPATAASTLAEVKADVVIIELPTLRDADLAPVASTKAACGASSAIVLYRFAPSAVVRRMRMAGHAVARATSDPFEMEAICLSLLHRPPLEAGNPPDTPEPRPPKFDERTLAELAAASRAVECECPRHLVELVLNLASFERYSAQCASLSPADAALHLNLQRAAGHARVIIEQALERVAIAEGFPLAAASEGP